MNPVENFLDHIKDIYTAIGEHREHLAQNPQTLPEVLDKLAEQAQQILTQQTNIPDWIALLLNNTSLNTTTLDRLTNQIVELLQQNTQQDYQKLKFIKNPNTNPKLLHQIPLTSATRVWLTQNPDCPTDILQKIWQTTGTPNLTKPVILAHRNCPEKLKNDAYLACLQHTGDNYETYLEVCANPTLSTNQLQQLTQKLNPTHYSWIAQNPNCPAELIEQTYPLYQADPYTHLALLQNPNFDHKHLPEILKTIPADNRNSVQNELLKHICQHTPNPNITSLENMYGIHSWKGLVLNTHIPINDRLRQAIRVLADDTVAWADTYDVYLGVIEQTTQPNNYQNFGQLKQTLQILVDYSLAEDSMLIQVLTYNKVAAQHILEHLPVNTETLTTENKIWLTKYAKDNSLHLPQTPVRSPQIKLTKAKAETTIQIKKV